MDYSSYVGSNAVSLTLNGSTAATATIAAMNKTDTLKNIEIIISGSGNDTIAGDTVNNSIDGGAGDDSLSGAAGIDTLIGGEGNDTLEGGANADSLVGGNGTDTASYAAGAAVNASLASPASNTGVDALGDTYTSIENLLGSGFNDTLTGSSDAVANILSGGAGDDTFKATAGGSGDTYYGGTVTGDAGIDVVDYSVLSTNISIQLSNGSNTIVAVSGTQNDTLSGIENIISGTGNDTITGNDAANILSGGVGNDSLDGGLGNDSLSGGAGTDTLIGGGGDDTLDGGAGADSLVGGAGTDTVTYASSGTAPVTVDLTNSGNGAGDAQGDVIDSTVEIIIGGAGNDTFIGRITAETIQGGAGDDTIKGSLGADSIDGQGGTADVMDYSSSAAVTINLTTAGSTQVGDQAQGDVLTNIEKIIGSATGDDKMTAGATAMNFDGNGGNDSLTGGAGSDTLTGGAGNDTLSGGDGNNSLDGGVGDDKLTTGIGNDTLLGGAGNDTLDGGDGVDSLQGGDGVDNLTGGAGNDTLDFATSNTSLVGDSGAGGIGDDIFKIDQSKLVTGNFSTLDGGAGNDTLQFSGSTSATIDLNSLSAFNSFEILDVSADSVISSISLSSAGIQGLVDNGNSSVLNIKLSSTDLVSISTTGTETWSFNNTSNTYSFIQNGNIVAQAVLG